jgi:shikimate dehydrogenase
MTPLSTANIGARTGLLGVIGWPVAHSRSPAMHNAALRALGLDYVYLAFAVESGHLPQAIAGARALGVRGLNVTVPHKEAALALCEPDEVARAVGAVNTLIFDADGVRGTNTDVLGFRALYDEAGGAAPGRAVILGAGGAARAVIAALQNNYAPIVVASRSGRALPGAEAARWPDSPAAARALFDGATLLVDATPRGLDDSLAPPELDALPDGALVLDLVVRRATALTRAARARSLHAHAGAAMLLGQGAASFERWLGRPAPVEIMRAALDASLDPPP